MLIPGVRRQTVTDEAGEALDSEFASGPAVQLEGTWTARAFVVERVEEASPNLVRPGYYDSRITLCKVMPGHPTSELSQPNYPN